MTIRLDVYLERRAADLRFDAVTARQSGDAARSRRLLAESRELDRRAVAVRKLRSDEEDRRMAKGLARLLDAMDGRDRDAG